MNLDINGIKNASMFFVKKNWPTIATVGGCAGVIAGTVLATPSRDQVDLVTDGTIDPQLIVELYSK